MWTQDYKDFFIDTILLQYPAPALFLYEEIEPQGSTLYQVVDGKQRLMTIFEFVAGEFPVSDAASKVALRGKYFTQFTDDEKRDFWAYQFSVEYIPSTEDNVVNTIFDRINRNVAKLSRQELRHARLDGIFITLAETLSEYLIDRLVRNFPRFTPRARAQMKDVEFVAYLLLLLEEGPTGYSQDDLDSAFVLRDASWDNREGIERRFREVVEQLAVLSTLGSDPPGSAGTLAKSRLANQADFYSLFGALDRAILSRSLPDPTTVVERLIGFADIVDDEAARAGSELASGYYEAARSASNDTGPRTTRIETLVTVIRSTAQGADS